MKREEKNVVIICFVLSIFIFILDSITPAVVDIWVLYIIPGILIYNYTDGTPIYYFSVLFSILCILSDFISPGSSSLFKVLLINRIIGLAAIWTVMYLLKHNRQALAIINELEETKKKLDRQTADLSATNHNLEAFVYSVSHDLKNPVQAVRGCCEILKEGIKSENEEMQEALAHALPSTERMGLVINDLMSLSKIASRELKFIACNLSQMAESIVEELRLLDPERKVQCIIEPGLIASADDGLIWILLQNLISNAWKYTSQKTDARIEFGKMTRDGSTFYFVRDNGVGFDMANAPVLFRLFQRLHTSREYPGTGIGLAIVKRIIERHGGTIWAEAEKDKGATFIFELGF